MEDGDHLRSPAPEASTTPGPIPGLADQENSKPPRSGVSLAIINCLLQETAKFHALSLRNMAAIMLLSAKTTTPMVATRSSLDCPLHWIFCQCMKRGVYGLAIIVVNTCDLWSIFFRSVTTCVSWYERVPCRLSGRSYRGKTCYVGLVREASRRQTSRGVIARPSKTIPENLTNSQLYLFIIIIIIIINC